MTHLTSCRNVISIEHTTSTSAVLVFNLFFWLVLAGFAVYLHICTWQNYILFQISASGLFLKFRKFQPRYSYKIYSYKKECILYELCWIEYTVEPPLTATSEKKAIIFVPVDDPYIRSYFNLSTTTTSTQRQRPLKCVPTAKVRSFSNEDGNGNVNATKQKV